MPVLLAALALPHGAALRAQQLEARGGVALSSVLARESGASGAAAATAGAAAAPFLGLTLLLPLRPGTQLDAGVGWAFSRLTGAAGAQSWRGGQLGIGQAIVGVRWAPPRRPYLRAGVGALRYSAAHSGIFSAGSALQPVVEAGAGWRWRAGTWALGAELAGQLHAFQTQALRDAGAASGGVRRLQALLTLGRGGKP